MASRPGGTCSAAGHRSSLVGTSFNCDSHSRRRHSTRRPWASPCHRPCCRRPRLVYAQRGRAPAWPIPLGNWGRRWRCLPAGRGAIARNCFDNCCSNIRRVAFDAPIGEWMVALQGARGRRRSGAELQRCKVNTLQPCPLATFY